MAGKIKWLIDYIIEKRSQENATLAVTTKTKIMLKGINPEAFSATSNDVPAIELRLREIGKELGITF